MDEILISAHSIMRWAVLLLGLYAITKSIRGLSRKQEYTANHNLSATLFLASVHLQALLGILLYVAREWYQHMSEMGVAKIRFWTVEHTLGMLIAVVLIQVGRTKSKKATEAARKHKLSVIFFSIGLLIILAMIPWPFRADIGRALWP